MSEKNELINFRIEISKSNLVEFCEMLKSKNVGYYLYPNTQKNKNMARLYLKIKLSNLYQITEFFESFNYKNEPAHLERF